MCWIDTKIQVVIELCEEEISKRQTWLSNGDYLEQEKEPIKADIKRFKQILKTAKKPSLFVAN